MNFCLIAWGGKRRVCDKSKMNRALKCAGKMMNSTQHDIVDLTLLQLCDAKLKRVIKDTADPLNAHITWPQRSGRILHIKTKTNRHINSFLPLPWTIGHQNWNH